MSDAEIQARIDNPNAFAPVAGGVFASKHTEKMGSTGLHVFTFLILLQNRNAPPVGVAAVSGRQVARFMGLALSTVQRAIARLEGGGYITRYPGGGWHIKKAWLGKGRRAASDSESRSPSGESLTANRDHRDLESRSPSPEEVTSNRDQADSESRSPVTSNRDHHRSRSAITVTAESGHDPPKLPYGSTSSGGGEGRRKGDVREGETLQDSSAASALAPVKPNPHRFVCYWQDANEERDFGLRIEPVEGIEELVTTKAEELGLRASREQLGRLVQRTTERFVVEYSRRDRSGKTRGQRIGPQRLTEEYAGWLRKDLASAAARASPRGAPVTKEQHRNQDAERRKQRIREAEEREQHGERKHDTQRRGLAPR